MSLNIWTGRAYGLDMSLCVLLQGNVDVGFKQETKLMQVIHNHNGVGYNVWAMEADTPHLGGVAVVWRAAKRWQLDFMASFGHNVVSFLLTLGTRRWYVVG